MGKVQLHGSDQLTTAVEHAYSATVPAGATLHVAGVAPLDQGGTTQAPGDVQGQVRAAVANLRVILGEQGAELSDVARLTVFVAEHLQVDLQVAAETLAEVFVDLPPVSIVGVSRLRYDDQVVELEAVAAL
ncbi:MULTISPECIES: RidA family protein [Tsukamurella]|uniref:RidA family protein n=2 Tax=Tsukamurella TaxID=2060 RepID=A0A5C5RY74_9ACTN|nr:MULTISPECIES: RidA family protein [Tsukamurella]NMD56619.1 RidA family protein [Tsukamurella columbiensis]TWS27453.1 RidA family protein [Tsukamurella conjunctivitidis]